MQFPKRTMTAGPEADEFGELLRQIIRHLEVKLPLNTSMDRNMCYYNNPYRGELYQPYQQMMRLLCVLMKLLRANQANQQTPGNICAIGFGNQAVYDSTTELDLDSLHGHLSQSAPLQVLLKTYRNNQAFPIMNKRIPAIRYWDNTTRRLEDLNPEDIVEKPATAQLLQDNPQQVVRVVMVNDHLTIHTNMLTWRIVFFAFAYLFRNMAERGWIKPVYKDLVQPMFDGFEYLATNNPEKAEENFKKFLEDDSYLDTLTYVLDKHYYQGDSARMLSLRAQLTSTKDEISKYLDQLQTTQAKLNQLTNELTTLELRNDDSFAANVRAAKAIALNQDLLAVLPYPNIMYNTNAPKLPSSWVMGEVLTLYFKSPMSDFDEAAYIRCRGSYMHQTVGDNNWLTEPFGTLLDAIFLERTQRVWLHSVIALNTRTFDVKAVTSEFELMAETRNAAATDFPAASWKNYLKHPHIDLMHCWGNHPTQIRDWLTSSNPEGVFTQITHAIRNINISDSLVFKTFLRQLLNEFNTPCLEDQRTKIKTNVLDYITRYCLEHHGPDYFEQDTPNIHTPLYNACRQHANVVKQEMSEREEYNEID